MKASKGLSAVVAALSIFYASDSIASNHTNSKSAVASESTNTSLSKKFHDYHFSKAISLADNATNGAGLTLEKRIGLAKDSLNEFDKAISITYSIEPLTEKADLLIEFENYKAANRLLDEVLQRNPDYAKANRVMGRLLRKTNRISEAEEYQRKALILDNKDPSNYTALACTLYIQNKISEAENLYHKSLELNRVPPTKKQKESKYDALFMLGEIHKFRKDYVSAEKYLNEAKQSDSRRVDAYVSLGELKMLKNNPSAIKEFEDAVRIVPGNEQYQNMLNFAKEKFK